MTDTLSKQAAAQVVEISDERVRRLRLEVDRLARLPTVEWQLYVETTDLAAKYGLDKAKLTAMVKAVIAENEKQVRENRGELSRRQKKEDATKRVEERKRARGVRDDERRERDDERREREEERKAERKARDKERTFEAIIRLPSTTHERKLKALAKRIDEDLDVLRREFKTFTEEGKDEIGEVAPWPDAVNSKKLLAEVLAQLRRYVVVSDEQAVAITLWVAFAWCHDVATHSPLLALKSAEADSGKTTTAGVLKFLCPRAHSAVEMSGPALFRFVDRVHPTLIIDDADRLLQRKPDVGHIINAGWTRGSPIPRVGPYGNPVWFDVFCPKAIAGANLLLPKTTATRIISIQLLPKLPSEKVENFDHIDDEQFLTLRRKLARWSIDNMEALKAADPTMPPGFVNRLAMNWRLQLAVADLAGGDWPKRARAAAVKLDDMRREEAVSESEGVRALAALDAMFAERDEIPSEEAVRRLKADPSGEWCEFRNRGPITQRQLAVLLKAYGIRPVVLHPTKRSDFSPHGYKLSQFANVFSRWLPNRSAHPHTPKRPKRK
jgi:putative DNA primase/helicase